MPLLSAMISVMESSSSIVMMCVVSVPSCFAMTCASALSGKQSAIVDAVPSHVVATAGVMTCSCLRGVAGMPVSSVMSCSPSNTTLTLMRPENGRSPERPPPCDSYRAMNVMPLYMSAVVFHVTRPVAASNVPLLSMPIGVTGLPS